MALIENFVRQDKERFKVHEAIEAHVCSFEAEGGRVLQIDTYGRGTRANPHKISQSVQLDRRSAGQLYEILKAEFGFK
ncbi:MULTISPECIES: methionyl-tRNA formyltransferase [unclassified Xanthobacter]|uniref:methionyl-tRNA formyltransferase n=1 Tax=unclassified Xanthobacter TaxID=2623496 RepID=UPI00145FBA8B|nr:MULTISPECIES: methionyl-tRNA formyltransferase [unclassified Xanthobacter]NMN57711.1 hypothetical protein [Xanthobacter sp. SG618]UJX47191.1 methionyl-tRNA formyltransferase [Xanthobacter sp. YC-JY1]